LLQPIERLPGVSGILQEFHVLGLKEEHVLEIAARVHAGKTSAFSGLIDYSEPQIRKRWEEVKDFILVPLGLDRHNDMLTGMWIVLHATCCTAPSFLLLKNDIRFKSGSG